MQYDADSLCSLGLVLLAERSRPGDRCVDPQPREQRQAAVRACGDRHNAHDARCDALIFPTPMSRTGQWSASVLRAISTALMPTPSSTPVLTPMQTCNLMPAKCGENQLNRDSRHRPAGTSSFADWWTRLPTTTAAMTLVQTSDGSSFAFTSANLYPIPGEPWYTMEVGPKWYSLYHYDYKNGIQYIKHKRQSQFLFQQKKMNELRVLAVSSDNWRPLAAPGQQRQAAETTESLASPLVCS